MRYHLSASSIRENRYDDEDMMATACGYAPFATDESCLSSLEFMIWRAGMSDKVPTCPACCVRWDKYVDDRGL